jgi:hypothetical protein
MGCARLSFKPIGLEDPLRPNASEKREELLMANSKSRPN